MTSARVVANRLLQLAAADGRSLTPMQVLKLVYIAHGWSLGVAGAPLIDEDVEAWQYGPVIPDLYRAMKGFGGTGVRGPLPAGWGANAEALTPAQDNLVEQVYRLYGAMSGMQLSAITHAKGTPWALTYSPGVHGQEIDTALIKDHYERLKRERAQRANA